MNIDITFTQENYYKLVKYLDDNSSVKLSMFNKRIVPNINNFKGIPVGTLRKTVDILTKHNDISFIYIKKEYSVEEILIEGMFIAKQNLPFNEFIKAFYKYSIITNSWMTCDGPKFNIIKDNKDKFIDSIDELLFSKDTYKVRLVLVQFINFYLTVDYIDIILLKIIKIENKDYYVSMSLAWLLTEAIYLFNDKILNFVLQNNFSLDIIKYFIRKIKETNKLNKEYKSIIISKVRECYYE